MHGLVNWGRILLLVLSPLSGQERNVSRKLHGENMNGDLFRECKPLGYDIIEHGLIKQAY